MRAAILGANGGIGQALCRALLARADTRAVYALTRNAPELGSGEETTYHPLHADLTDEASLAKASAQIRTDGPLDLVIVATGLLSKSDTLRPEKSWREQSLSAFEQIFAANTFGPALAAKHLLPLLDRKSASRIGFLSARVGSITDNHLGGWHAYRASKAALNMLVKNYALELQRRNENAVCVSLHPGTVETKLSAPFTSGSERKLFTPDEAAQYLLNTLLALTPADSGKHFDWAGKEIPA